MTTHTPPAPRDTAAVMDTLWRQFGVTGRIAPQPGPQPRVWRACDQGDRLAYFAAQRMTACERALVPAPTRPTLLVLESPAEDIDREAFRRNDSLPRPAGERAGWVAGALGISVIWAGAGWFSAAAIVGTVVAVRWVWSVFR